VHLVTNANGKEQGGAPLAWSQGGDLIDLPAAAVAWRVKRLSASAKGGAPEVVYSDGVPLVVPVTIGAADFAESVEHVPGKYRLDALDESQRPVQGVPPAYHVVKAKVARATMWTGEPADVAVQSLANAFVSQNEALAGMVTACAELMRELKALVPSPNTWVPVMQAAVPPTPPPAPRNGNGTAMDDHDERRGERSVEEEDEEEATLLQQIVESLRDLGPDNLMALGKAVPEMVGGLIRETKGAFAGDAKGNGGQS
jgi:hypothetical protein